MGAVAVGLTEEAMGAVVGSTEEEAVGLTVEATVEAGGSTVNRPFRQHGSWCAAPTRGSHLLPAGSVSGR